MRGMAKKWEGKYNPGFLVIARMGFAVWRVSLRLAMGAAEGTGLLLRPVRGLPWMGSHPGLRFASPWATILRRFAAQTGQRLRGPTGQRINGSAAQRLNVSTAQRLNGST